RRLEPLWIHRIRPGDLERLEALQGLLKSAGAADQDVLVEVRHHGGALIGERVDAYIRCVEGRHIDVRRVDLESLLRPKPKHVNAHAALRKAEGDAVRLLVDQRDVGVGTDAKVGLAHLNLGAAGWIGKDTVSRS